MTQTELAEWHGVQGRTIYSWLTRLDTGESLEQAVTDNNQIGRNRKISGLQYEYFVETVHAQPENVGVDAPAWMPTLSQDHLQEAYGVEYSVPSCRRLFKGEELSYQKSYGTAVEVDGDEQGEFHDEREECDGRWTPR